VQSAALLVEFSILIWILVKSGGLKLRLVVKRVFGVDLVENILGRSLH